MNSWSPERRRRFAALVVGTLVVLVVLWQGGIVTLQGWLRLKQTEIDSAQAQLRLAESARSLRSQYEAELEADLRKIQALEATMARGDLFRWMINHVLDLQDLHRVDVSSRQLQRVTELDVPPLVPYKAATYSINGNARYHDLGAFLADFENSSPFIRLRGLTIQAAAPGFTGATEPERLAFQVDFSTLINTNSPAR